MTLINLKWKTKSDPNFFVFIVARRESFPEQFQNVELFRFCFSQAAPTLTFSSKSCLIGSEVRCIALLRRMKTTSHAGNETAVNGTFKTTMASTIPAVKPEEQLESDLIQDYASSQPGNKKAQIRIGVCWQKSSRWLCYRDASCFYVTFQRALTVLAAAGIPGLIHQHLPARVHERAAEEEGVHSLVHQPIKHHLPVPRTNGHPQLEAAAIQVVVAAEGKHVHHLHVEGDGGAQGDGGQLIGHLFTVDKDGAWTQTAQAIESTQLAQKRKVHPWCASAYRWWKYTQPDLFEVTPPPSGCRHTRPGCPCDPPDPLQRFFTKLKNKQKRRFLGRNREKHSVFWRSP